MNREPEVDPPQPDWSALEQQFEPAVVPDSIEPIVAWRSWRWDTRQQKLMSGFDDTVWEPGQPTKAACNCAPEFFWEVVPHGKWSLAQAQDYSNEQNDRALKAATMSRSPLSFHVLGYVPYPTVQPAPGYGYRLARKPHHEAPHEDCSCGLYAADDRDGAMAGVVVGKVNLWGKVIPGERGYRAQYGYPLELHAPETIAPHLAKYGVKVVAADTFDPFEHRMKSLRRRQIVCNAMIVIAIANLIWAFVSMVRLAV